MQYPARYPGIGPIKVYSCTENSNLNEFFPYIPFEDFLNGERQPEVEIDREHMKIPSLEGHTTALLGPRSSGPAKIVDAEKVFNRKDKSE